MRLLAPKLVGSHGVAGLVSPLRQVAKPPEEVSGDPGERSRGVSVSEVRRGVSWDGLVPRTLPSPRE